MNNLKRWNADKNSIDFQAQSFLPKSAAASITEVSSLPAASTCSVSSSKFAPASPRRWMLSNSGQDRRVRSADVDKSPASCALWISSLLCFGSVNATPKYLRIEMKAWERVESLLTWILTPIDCYVDWTWSDDGAEAGGFTSWQIGRWRIWKKKQNLVMSSLDIMKSYLMNYTTSWWCHAARGHRCKGCDNHGKTLPTDTMRRLDHSP